MKLPGPRPRPGVARDTLFSLVGIAVVGGSTALYSLAVGRWLGETALGHAGLALAVGVGLAQVVVSGLGPATTRFTAARLSAGARGAAWSALGRGLVGAVGLGALLAAAVWLGGDWWAARIGLPRHLAQAAAALVALQSAYLALKAGLYGLGRVPAYAASELVAGLVFLAALAALLLGARLSLVAPFLAANAVFVAVAVAATARARRRPLHARPPPARAEEEGPGMASFAVIATVGSAAALARLSLAPLVTGLYWPAAQVGLLQAAFSFFLVVMLVPRALELALFPALARAHGRRDRAAFMLQARTALEVSSLVLALVAGTLILAGPGLLTALYGPAFAAAAPALLAVLVSGWALGLAVPAVAALSGANAVAVPNTAAVLGLAVSLAVWSQAVPAHGAWGAAAGLAAGSLVIAAVVLAAAARRLRLDLRPAALVSASSIALLAVFACASHAGDLSLLAGPAYAAAVAGVHGRRALRLARGALPARTA